MCDHGTVERVPLLVEVGGQTKACGRTWRVNNCTRCTRGRRTCRPFTIFQRLSPMQKMLIHELILFIITTCDDRTICGIVKIKQINVARKLLNFALVQFESVISHKSFSDLHAIQGCTVPKTDIRISAKFHTLKIYFAQPHKPVVWYIYKKNVELILEFSEVPIYRSWPKQWYTHTRQSSSSWHKNICIAASLLRKPSG